MKRFDSAYEKAYETGRKFGALEGVAYSRLDKFGLMALTAGRQKQLVEGYTKDRIFVASIPVLDRSTAQRGAKATREGMICALGGGIRTANEKQSPQAQAFLRERVGEIVREGEWFDFGDTVGLGSTKGRDDWQQFAALGLVDLPFPRTVFRSRCDMRENDWETKDFLDLVFVAEQTRIGEPITLACFMVDAFKTEPLLLAACEQFSKASLQAFALAGKERVIALGFFPLWLILNTKGVHQERIVPPEKLNRARVKSGKEPLKAFTRVDGQSYMTALRETERMESGEGGTHASPRPHLRRAHLRHLHDGRIIPIMAMIVNGSAGLKIAQREKYMVQK